MAARRTGRPSAVAWCPAHRNVRVRQRVAVAALLGMGPGHHPAIVGTPAGPPPRRLSKEGRWMGEATKFWIAVVGGAATSVIVVFGGDTIVGKCAAIVVAAATAGSVYVAKNQ